MTRGEFGADEFVNNASVHLPPEKVRNGWLLLPTAFIPGETHICAYVGHHTAMSVWVRCVVQGT